MNSFDLSVRVSSALARYKSLSDSYQSDLARLDELAERIEQIRAEQATLETSRTVMDQVKKILTKSSLDYCEKLATLAVRSIFNIDAEVKYSATDGKFFLVYSNGMMSDIAGDEGGGMKVVISFIFSLYLVIKSSLVGSCSSTSRSPKCPRNISRPSSSSSVRFVLNWGLNWLLSLTMNVLRSTTSIRLISLKMVLASV